MKKINYYDVGTSYLNSVDLSKGKPSLLLHVCCAPCATYPLQLLEKFFNITIFYENSNIYPQKEYLIRVNELRQYLIDNHPSINLIEPKYDYAIFNEKIKIRKDDKEGGPRCKLCFYERLNTSFKYAHENNFDYFTTALTISSLKDAKSVNRIGLILEKRYPGTVFIPHDFKKKKGQEIAIRLSRENNLYRQTYCGCAYSYNEMLIRKKQADL